MGAHDSFNFEAVDRVVQTLVTLCPSLVIQGNPGLLSLSHALKTRTAHCRNRRQITITKA